MALQIGLGHLNFNSLVKLSKTDLVRGLPHLSPHSSTCEGCMLGKQDRTPLPKESKLRASRPLELIHTDLCGPMAVTSIGGQRYFKVFLDDYTLKTGLSMRKSKKDEPLANLKHFMIEQERFTGCKLKVRRSDRGGEFLSKDFVCLVPTPAELYIRRLFIQRKPKAQLPSISDRGYVPFV